MGQRLLRVAEQIIGLIVRGFQAWFRLIGRQDTLRAKVVVAAVGLLVICFACSIPVAVVQGPRTPIPAAQLAAVAPAATKTAPATVTTAPTDTLIPTATTAPTDLPAPTATQTSTPTLTLTPAPTNTPRPTAKPKPTIVTATDPLNTHGADLYNCSDFATYRQAYAVYKANLPGDPNDLDRDGDGIPCESLPGAP